MARFTRSRIVNVVAVCGLLLLFVVGQSFATDDKPDDTVKGRLETLEALVKDLQTDRDKLQEELDTLRGEYDAHTANASAHHSKTTSFADLTDTATDGQIPDNITVNYAIECGDADTVDGKHAADLDASGLGSRVADLEDLLMHFWRDGDEVYIEGANLHVVNGTGTTDGDPNSLGNIIIGYNESRGSSSDPDVRTGSHMMLVGDRNNYSSFGGIVVGHWNTASGRYASVSGGAVNTASGVAASVSGGDHNEASGDFASVSGGDHNEASGDFASVSGGEFNTASGWAASISGGQFHTTTADYEHPDTH